MNEIVIMYGKHIRNWLLEFPDKGHLSLLCVRVWLHSTKNWIHRTWVSLKHFCPFLETLFSMEAFWITLHQVIAAGWWTLIQYPDSRIPVVSTHYLFFSFLCTLCEMIWCIQENVAMLVSIKIKNSEWPYQQFPGPHFFDRCRYKTGRPSLGWSLSHKPQSSEGLGSCAI